LHDLIPLDPALPALGRADHRRGRRHHGLCRGGECHRHTSGISERLARLRRLEGVKAVLRGRRTTGAAKQGKAPATAD
jgi:hypothetical protein